MSGPRPDPFVVDPFDSLGTGNPATVEIPPSLLGTPAPEPLQFKSAPGLHVNPFADPEVETVFVDMATVRAVRIHEMMGVSTFEVRAFVEGVPGFVVLASFENVSVAEVSDWVRGWLSKAPRK